MECNVTSSNNEVTSQHLECFYYSCLPYFTSLKWTAILSMCLPSQVLKRRNNFREIWYKFYTTGSIEKCVYVVIFPHYTSQIQRHILYKTKFHFYC